MAVSWIDAAACGGFSQYANPAVGHLCGNVGGEKAVEALVQFDGALAKCIRCVFEVRNFDHCRSAEASLAARASAWLAMKDFVSPPDQGREFLGRSFQLLPICGGAHISSEVQEALRDLACRQFFANDSAQAARTNLLAAPDHLPLAESEAVCRVPQSVCIVRVERLTKAIVLHACVYTGAIAPVKVAANAVTPTASASPFQFMLAPRLKLFDPIVATTPTLAPAGFARWLSQAVLGYLAVEVLRTGRFSLSPA